MCISVFVFSILPKLGYNQGGLWTSQWHPLARAPGCFTMLSHFKIQLLLGSQSWWSMLGYLANPRCGHRCSLDTNIPSFIANHKNRTLRSNVPHLTIWPKKKGNLTQISFFAQNTDYKNSLIWLQCFVFQARS